MFWVNISTEIHRKLFNAVKILRGSTWEIKFSYCQFVWHILSSYIYIYIYIYSTHTEYYRLAICELRSVVYSLSAYLLYFMPNYSWKVLFSIKYYLVLMCEQIRFKFNIIVTAYYICCASFIASGLTTIEIIKNTG